MLAEVGRRPGHVHSWSNYCLESTTMPIPKDEKKQGWTGDGPHQLPHKGIHPKHKARL